MHRFLLACSCLLLYIPAAASDGNLYSMPPETTQSRWISFENPTGAKGEGGKANRGGKGAAFDRVPAGETKPLLEVSGSGTLHRMWFTLSDRKPEMLRALRLRIYWDGAATPAVDVPFGDFFGAILGHMRAFESELFSNPEGRSFNTVLQMPFRSGAKVTISNESGSDLEQLFFDINYTLNAGHPENTLYFHAIWRRERWTELERDFEILPHINGRGRFLGTHIGIQGHPDNIGWWGEGEVKIFLDGDADFPTIVGTGTEDYVGTAYGQGEFAHRFQGSLLINNEKRRWTFYRYHIPDPVYFHQDIRVTIQQMGGTGKAGVLKLLKAGVEVKPVSVHDKQFVPLLERDLALDDPSVPDGWTNMYRRDDVSAVALFYLDRPENGLPPLADAADRSEALAE